MRQPAPAPPSGRIAATFARCAREQRAALVTYVMGGDPSLKASETMALACVAGGADLLEIGVPFSDPIADGPTIQRASERALQAGTTLSGCLELVGAVRRKVGVPIVLMGYVNPVLAMGEARFFAGCRNFGVDAVILTDLPPEEAGEIRSAAQANDVRMVFLLAPTSTPARQQAACAAADGFVYFVSVTGVTGARRALPPELGEQLAGVRRRCPVPVVVGFGISTPEQAGALGALADGVVVGSAIVSRIAQRGTTRNRAERVRRFVHQLRGGLIDRARKS